MPYVPGSTAHGVVHVADVYNSPNVYANNVPIALHLPQGGTGAYSLNVSVASVVIEAAETVFVMEKSDVDSIDSTNSSTIATYGDSVVSSGVSSGTLTPAETAPTTVGTPDTTPPPAVTTSTVQKADWNKFNANNIPYDTLMLTEKTSLADFTTKSALWKNQPKPFGPNAQQPGAGDNKHIKEQDIFVRGKGKVGSVTVPQILHNLSNLALNIWEPVKKKYPNAIVTNTFRQNPPGGSAQQAQHGLGMAMDIQFPGADAQKYYEIAVWMRDNLPFDQLLQEKAGSTRWIHVSHYSGFGYQVPKINKVANVVVSPTSSFVPGLSVMA